jgi:hypothetical protein
MKRIVWLLCGLLAVGPAFAGTEITIETRKAGAPADAKPQRSVVEVEGRMLRAEMDGGRRGALWHGEEGALEILDHADKRVFRIDRATAQNVKGAREGLRNGLEGLPGASPEVVDRWLGGTAPPPMQLKSSGKSAQVNGVGCRLLDALRGGVRIAELCEGPPGSAGVTAAALAPARELAVFLAEVGDLLPPSLGGEGLDALVLAKQVQGVPLRVRAWPKDGPATESRIVQAVTKSFPPDRFQAPADYSPGLSVHVRGE